MGVALLIGALASALAAVLPGRRAARLPVVDALRQNI
jgi:putative ABC transport system permease protein